MSQKSSSHEQQDPSPTKMKPQIASLSESDILTVFDRKRRGETETHGSALKRYASISLQLCGLSVLACSSCMHSSTNSSCLILCAITCLHPCIS
ncbi:hypothetical protein D8674_038235 [Pyrus ussuriensis x Pyrus communis]|uniref:Uncharacterized protein n=1 Tax=Pyrus ussuriensis x Pyrus communis TaxID=2448454 RepID=A0A5N5I294_9ROSA|nr:hypothetical protein D8674_038235 [Pyrus ussuriensis x Pyrus communis]